MRSRLILALVFAALLSADPALAARSPSLGRTAVVNKVAGTVWVKDRGENRFTRLPRSRTLVRMGAKIDATNGRARVRTAAGAGRPLNNGVFSKGVFTISQRRRANAITNLKLLGGNFRSCGKGAGTRTVRSLRGRGRGRFKTRGRYSAATVRGTQWVVEDRCNGTRTAAERGSVQTDTDGELAFVLDAGDEVQYFCDFDGLAPVSQAFCTVVLNRPADGLWGAGIINLGGDATSYDLYLSDPTGAERFGTFPFTEPDADGFRQSAVVCNADRGPGPYSVRWVVGGVQLGPPIGFTGTQPPSELFCISEPE